MLIRQSAEDVLAIQANYAERGLSMAQVAMAGSNNFVEFRHYPKNDLVDLDSGYEMYYHSHSLNQKKKYKNLECGHFHLFKRDKFVSDQFTHLIAISIDVRGLPIRLFTTNGWVTGEVMKDVNVLKPLLDNFQMKVKGPMSPLARWINGLMFIFQSEILAVLKARDQKINKMIFKNKTRVEVLGDRRHHVLSEVEINFLRKMESLVKLD